MRSSALLVRADKWLKQTGTAQAHQPGVCCYSLGENQSISGLVDGYIKALAEPKPISWKYKP